MILTQAVTNNALKYTCRHTLDPEDPEEGIIPGRKQEGALQALVMLCLHLRTGFKDMFSL